MASLSLTLFEVVFLFLCAIVVGFVLHFFLTTRKNLNRSMQEAKKSNGMDEWKLKYFNDMEIRDKELEELRSKFEEADENSKIYQMEADEMKRQNKKLVAELEIARTTRTNGATESKSDYYEQLRSAQQSLLDHNEKISQLLEQVEVIRESEQKTNEIQKYNHELSEQINELQDLLSQKEAEMNQIRQKEHMTKEMSSMLDNAYDEFSILQSKIRKLESQLSASRMISIAYEDMKESQYKIGKELEEQKNKVTHYMHENHNLQMQLAKTEDKLSEANLQRQQLQKKVAYLEELNRDLQQMSETNKKLEGQLKRIGELESMLNLVADERDKLKDQQ
jgi:DNA repair exonuclease SbcCD ATPase subunit